MIETPLEIINQ